MDDRFNTIAGWTLFAGIVALGGAIVSDHVFGGGRPDQMGYSIEGVEAEGEAGAGDPPIATRLATADVAAGEKSFAKCVACHTANQGGANGIGPNVYAILGDQIGHGRGGFAFSDALKSKGGTWTFEAMDEWLKSPRAFAPGTKMTFAGLGNAQERANVIAYMNSLGSNLPLPTPPAEGAPEEDAAAAADNVSDNAANAAGATVTGTAESNAAPATGPAAAGH